VTRWEYQSITLAPGESWYDALRLNGANGWEAWHMERSDNGHRTLYFKRPAKPEGET
jgi:hypothetical protein